jgi:hypothetical protein
MTRDREGGSSLECADITFGQVTFRVITVELACRAMTVQSYWNNNTSQLVQSGRLDRTSQDLGFSWACVNKKACRTLHHGCSSLHRLHYVQCETEVLTKIAFFWDVMPCSLVDKYERFGGICCLPFSSR